MRKCKVMKIVSVVVAVVMLSSACGSQATSKIPVSEIESVADEVVSTVTSEGETESEKESETSATAETFMFTDSVGREVELPVNIERVAPTGTLAQIVMFALNPDVFVGLSGSWSETVAPFLNEKYLELPVFGQFYGTSDLNMEALAAANPQVLIDIGEKKESIEEDLDTLQEQLGIPVIFIEATMECMPETYQTLGELFHMEEDAKVLSDYCQNVYQRTVRGMEQITDGKKKILYCVGDTGTNVIAKGSFHAEILDLLGDNVAVVEDPSSGGSGNEISMEQIYLWNPDVIIFAPGSVYDSAGTDEIWMQLTAIQNGKYYEVPIGPYNWMGFPPSVNRYMGMIWLSNLLYPETFDYNLYEETETYYDLFYHYKMTEDKYAELTKNSLRK